MDRISQVLDAQPEPVVLVGHSSGSMVIRKAAEQCPDKIEMLLYVGAYPLRNSEVALSAYGNYTKSLVLLKLAMSEDGLSTTLREEAIREGLLDDVSDENVERAKSRFEPQAVAALASRLPSPKTTSAGYRGCTSKPSRTGPSAHRCRRRCTSGCPARRSSP